MQQTSQSQVDDPTVPALTAFVTWVLADSFDLRPEEAMWVRQHLGDTFAPLAGHAWNWIPLPVSQELETGSYSRRLDALDRSTKQGPPAAAPADVRYAGPEEWAAVVMQLVNACYSLRPMTESAMRGKLIGLMREMGVGKQPNPRASRFLPNDVVQLLNRRSEERR